ncbi:MAG TPA: hypothetical protein VH598_09780, partial [Verrucomicrobiae bacterium]|nr:hypothetical protein [Verrucomicrobiae bacterium]
ASGNPVEPLIPRNFSERRRAGLSHAIERGLAVPTGEQPSFLRSNGRRRTDSDKRRIADLQKIRDARAAELGIDPTLIASRAVLLDLVEDWSRHEPELMRWQRQLLNGAKMEK